MIRSSFNRMKDASNNVYALANLDTWLSKFTYINDKPFGFKDREFQLAILRDPSKDQVVVKCAQVGLSELSYRWAVAACVTQPNFSAIYTFPVAGDAVKACRTRIDPMIEASPELKRSVNPDLNNSELKQFGKNSFLYFKGTMAETAALSVPADAIIHDEVDRSNVDILTTYISRLQDKPTKIRKVFSTPTVKGHGVSLEAQNAKRYYHFVTCNSCNHSFLPDYFSHVVIPDFDDELETLNKNNLHQYRWEEAHLVCPSCGRDPDLHHTRMPWVCENPDENYYKTAWFVSPFSAHMRISVPSLVKTSTEYSKYSEFKNQALGLTAEDIQDSITEEDLDKAQALPIPLSSDLHQMGVDLGVTCHVTIGRALPTGELLVVHRERCHYTQLEARIQDLRIKYRVTTQVLDSQPYSDLVNRVCSSNHNAYGAVYVNSKSTNILSVKEESEDLESGKLGFRMVHVNRNIAFDELLSIIKEGSLLVSSSDEDGTFSAHLRSMKRVQKFTNMGDMIYTWVKTDGEDHYHHALLYLYVATKLRYTAGFPGLASIGFMPLQVVKAPKKRR